MIKRILPLTRSLYKYLKLNLEFWLPRKFSKRYRSQTTVETLLAQIIVLGGLMRTDESDTYERVPLLGDIPYLGAAFRKKSKKKDKINMMVFLRPTIVRNPEDLNRTTVERYEYIRTNEEESLPDTRYLLNQSPGIAQTKPEQIPPLQTSSPVLEKALENTDEVQGSR